METETGRLFSYLDCGSMRDRRRVARYISVGDLAAVFLCMLAVGLGVVQLSGTGFRKRIRTLAGAMGLAAAHGPSTETDDLAQRLRRVQESRGGKTLGTWSLDLAGVPVRAVRAPSGIRLELPGDVLFGRGQTHVSESGARLLDAVAAYLSGYAAGVEVVAYGSGAEGVDGDVLAWRRGAAVAEHLGRSGFDRERIRHVQGGNATSAADPDAPVEIILLEEVWESSL